MKMSKNVLSLGERKLKCDVAGWGFRVKNEDDRNLQVLPLQEGCFDPTSFIYLAIIGR